MPLFSGHSYSFLHISFLLFYTRTTFCQLITNNRFRLTAGQDKVLWDERRPQVPEGAMLCSRPALVIPLTHEEQIHRHGLTVLSLHHSTLVELRVYQVKSEPHL